jgi:hypothetical protein
MSNEDEIKWVALTLEFTPEQEAFLEARAGELGLSLKCYCVHMLYRHLLKDSSDTENEDRVRRFPATLRRNGCDENTYIGS